MKKFLVMVVAMVFALVGTAYSQQAKDAFEALSKLESKVEVGVSYQAYMDSLAEAHHAVKKFLDSSEAKKVPQFTEAIKKADMHFITASEMWDRRIKEDFFISPDSSLGREILRTYPEVKATPARTQPYPFPSFIPANFVHNAALKEAAKELKKAKLYLDRFQK